MVSAGCSDGSVYVQTFIAITANTRRRITIPKIRGSGTDLRNSHHNYNGVDGYRNMTIYLARRGYAYSSTTIHKYMNMELGLHSIVCPKKPDYQQGQPHKIFENNINQDFIAKKNSQKCCTDFTYLFLNSHEVRCNYTIIDLYGRIVATSITNCHITSTS